MQRFGTCGEACIAIDALYSVRTIERGASSGELFEFAVEFRPCGCSLWRTQG